MPNTKITIQRILLFLAFFCEAMTIDLMAANPVRNDSVRYVSARIIYDTYAQISWTLNEPLGYDNFETGDFNLLSWNNTISDFPWDIDTTHAYEGNCCMKSSCEGHDNGISEIEISYYVPTDGTMSFFSKISSEPSFDVGRFYIDGEKQFECSGESDWEQHRFDITEGIHWFRWSYLKDASIDNGDDCFYVDQVNFIENDSLSKRDLLYFSIFRRRIGEDSIMLATHLTDSSFIDMSWNALPWGQYSWGVSCTYSGEPPIESETRWSNVLDKDMTTTLEVNAITNTGIVPAGASIIVEPFGGQGETYSANLDQNGHILIPDIYRDYYTIQLQFDGYDDYISDTAVCIMGPTSIDIELFESTQDIDSLYVSSTGWAIWDGPTIRSLQYFEIAIDSTIVGTTSDQHFQFDVDTLTEGRTYRAAVRPVFQSWTGEWATYGWIYRSCQNFASVIDLEGIDTDEGTLISWTYPETESLLGAVYFREDEQLGFRYLGFTTDNYFIDTLLPTEPGIYRWYVRTVYDGDDACNYYSMACPEIIMTYIPLGCDAPELLTAETYYNDDNDRGALISWGPQPIPIEEWLYYDNGIFNKSIGSEDGAIFWGIKFEPEQLANFEGCSLTQISLYDIEAGTYQLLVCQGGVTQPGTLVYYQNLELEGTHGWRTIATEATVNLSVTEPLWIVIGQQGIAYPAAVCTDSGEANGRWVSLDGTHWTDLASYNLNFTWMLRAFVTDQIGKSRQLNNEGSALTNYNLYRSTTGANYELVAQIPFVEGEDFYQYHDNLSDLPEQTYFYQLTAEYDDGCESEPGTSAEDPNLDFVTVEVSWDINEIDIHKISLYPNPTSGSIRIEAKGARNITISDALGQVITSQDVHTDTINLDLSSLPDGLYLITIRTEEDIMSQVFMIKR